MINCEFKKNYFNLILGILFVIVFIVLTIVIMKYDAFGALTGACLGAIAGVSGYFIASFFVLNRQYLKFENDSFKALVMTSKNGRLKKFENNKSFIKSAHTDGKILVLVNERNEELTIYNIKNLKQVVDDINKLVNYQANATEE